MIWTDNDIHDDLTHEVIVHCTDSHATLEYFQRLMLLSMTFWDARLTM